MSIEPFPPGRNLDTRMVEVPGGQVTEISIDGIERLLDEAPEVQRRLCSVPVLDRLQVLDQMGKCWTERSAKGELDPLVQSLAKSTGYSSELVKMELSFVPAVLNGRNIERNLATSLTGGISALDSFADIGEMENIYHRPAGPSFIISSGNSIVPTLIPTTLSLITGNLTVLKPSLSNYEGVVEVFRTLQMVPESEAKDRLLSALLVTYLSHDSPVLDHVLVRGRFGVINFWGGEPARTVVSRKVAENPHRPHLMVNGPMTGVAWLETGAVGREVAQGLALDTVLYDQQLCSSPTLALFLGDRTDAKQFAEDLGRGLDEMGKGFPLHLEEGRMFALNNFRRVLQLRGATVLSSKSPINPWTIVVSLGKSNLDEAMVQNQSMGLYGRRRFIEIIVIQSEDQGMQLIAGLPRTKAWTGIDQVQTIGLAVGSDRYEGLSLAMAQIGAFRLVPVGDMYMRGAAEPYDGVTLASIFTTAVYRRDAHLTLEDQL